MKIEWNFLKKQLNIEKHGLNFEDAYEVFLGQTVTFIDNRKNYGETRYITLGELNNRAVVIAYTIREDKLRIISMRKANEREKKIYQKRLETLRQNDR